MTSLPIGIQDMPVWCAHGYHTKRIIVAEEIEIGSIELEIETERKWLMIELIELIEIIGKAVIIELMTTNNGWLFSLASVCLIVEELFHLLAQA